jgi:hypothetical protein
VLLNPKIHIASAAALLGAYGVWMLFGAVETHSWYMGVLGAVLLLAVGGAVTRQRWARFLVYAFATILTFQWLWIVGGQITSGFLIPPCGPRRFRDGKLPFIRFERSRF